MKATTLKNSLRIPRSSPEDDKKTMKLIADAFANDPRLHDDILTKINALERERFENLDEAWNDFNAKCFCDDRSEKEFRFADTIVRCAMRLANANRAYPAKDSLIPIDPKEICDALEWVLEDLAPYIVKDAQCLLMTDDEVFFRYRICGGVLHSETYYLKPCYSDGTVVS